MTTRSQALLELKRLFLQHLRKLFDASFTTQVGAGRLSNSRQLGCDNLSLNSYNWSFQPLTDVLCSPSIGGSPDNEEIRFGLYLTPTDMHQSSHLKRRTRGVEYTGIHGILRASAAIAPCIASVSITPVPEIASRIWLIGHRASM